MVRRGHGGGGCGGCGEAGAPARPPIRGTSLAVCTRGDGSQSIDCPGRQVDRQAGQVAHSAQAGRQAHAASRNAPSQSGCLRALSGSEPSSPVRRHMRATRPFQGM